MEGLKILSERLNNISDKIKTEDFQTVLPQYVYQKFNIVCYEENGNMRSLCDVLSDASKIYWNLSDSDKDDLRKCIMGSHCSKERFEGYIK